MWMQLLVNSLALGSFYALIAFGFALIFGVTRAFNLAHGELVLLGGYIACLLAKGYGIHTLWTLPFSIMALLGAALLLHAILRRLREPFELNTLVVTFGLALVLQNAMVFFFTADYRLIDPGSLRHLDLLGIQVSDAQLSVFALSITVTVALHLLMRKTFLGKALRATIQDREAARLAGIHVDHMTLVAFGLGGMLLGLAGPFYAQKAYLHPFGGSEPTLLAIIISIFAGVGRTRGILLGGWLLGAMESASVFLLGGSWRELVSAVLLIALLLLRPQGLWAGRGGAGGAV
ncbi:MAG: branched-chain amino acid ABC transporter permease [Syntrophobacteraceae bacterium]|jgi:branched-chain amino acid transport system permease protein|nr:branched-chain amino acid ABC transporter permease [Syntrophobacteraceae bacterium]MCU0588772.1 branched-chain amino acid ABC transporter permease [Syntrophobacteraceae bacterium]